MRLRLVRSGTNFDFFNRWKVWLGISGFLMLLALGVGSPPRRATRWRDEAYLWLPVLIYGLLTLTRGINIGNRHLLPIYPV